MCTLLKTEEAEKEETWQPGQALLCGTNQQDNDSVTNMLSLKFVLP
jgi:hypothetical protein